MVHIRGIPLGFLSIVVILSVVDASFPYYGTKIGPLSQLHHRVSGDVYAVDSRTIFIKDFNYDGGAPAAYFYVGQTSTISNGDGSWRIRDEKGSLSELTRRYRDKDITLSLPDGKTLRDIKWFSVWCDEYSVDFGSIKIPGNLDFPRPQKISKLRNLNVHGVSSDEVVIVDAQTLLIPNFSYDGKAPDAKFWVGRGSTPTSQGLKIPDENGKQEPLRRYDRKTIVLTLPGDLTIFDIGHFGIWCEAFAVDFGHIRIPEGLNVPPSLKMLGISPQSKLNCEVLYDELAFEVRWAVAGESIVVQLVAKLDSNEYMAFGISPNEDKTEMIGSDVAVAWIDKEGKGYAVDYNINAKAQCSGKKGSCPDTRINPHTNSVRLLNAAVVNGYSIVTYQRTLKPADDLDLPIFTNKTQAIVWAIGPLNERQETSFHSKYTKGNQFIDFGRQSNWNCPNPDEDKVIDDRDDEGSEEYYDNQEQAQALHQERQPTTTEASTTERRIATPKSVSRDDKAWVIPPIECWEPDDGVFYAQLGPTGGKHGYSAITGHVGWGISWYINGLLIPEIHVVRGKRYTFVTEGGNDPSIPAKYHPFYITDDPIGGYEHKAPEEKKNVTIFAGVHRSRTGKLTPTGIGRLCNWTPDQNGPDSNTFNSFGEYQRSLTLVCENGDNPGFISWTPDEKTPDTVYYHCFTHRYLGWKIHVHDFCESGQASDIDVVYAEPPDDIVAEPSIQREIRIRPNDNFLEKHKTNLIKNHNMNIAQSRFREQNHSKELTELLHEGIRAVEALEDKISKGKPPPIETPLIKATRPEMLKGEISIAKKNMTKYSHPNFLRPPNGMPLFRPKIPSAILDRRPNNRPRRPGLIAQPSIIMPHYRKPKPPLRSYPHMKESNNYLMLGEHSVEPVLKPKIKHSIKTSLPYSTDIEQADSMVTYVAMKNTNHMKTKKPLLKLPIMHDKPNIPLIGFKKPYEIKEIKETPLYEAVNEGFKPNTVVVESGFKPILRDYFDGNSTISQEANRRNDLKKDPAEEINKAMESDTLFLSGNAQKIKQSFEPMFIPSPLDRINTSTGDDVSDKPEAQEMVKPMQSDNEREIPVVEHPDEGDEMGETEIEDDEDELAVAEERIDSYYLPPYNAKRPSPGIPPEGAVVTYDGKAVLDKSLITPPKIEFKQHLKDVRKGLSSIEEYVLRTPQFGPFRGEIPPLTPNFLPQDIIKNPVTEYSNPFVTTTSSDSLLSPPKTISTKLSLIKSTV